MLVDLAMIRAAGQGDVEVSRVSCLHLAVTGFAPLIYDLKENAGFEELMDCLEEVWRVLQNDKSLPDRLVRILYFLGKFLTARGVILIIKKKDAGGGGGFGL